MVYAFQNLSCDLYLNGVHNKLVINKSLKLRSLPKSTNLVYYNDILRMCDSYKATLQDVDKGSWIFIYYFSHC